MKKNFFFLKRDTCPGPKDSNSESASRLRSLCIQQAASLTPHMNLMQMCLDPMSSPATAPSHLGVPWLALAKLAPQSPLRLMCVHLVAQSCLILCDPMDCSLPGSSVHGDYSGKNTGVGCHALLQGIFPIQGSNSGLPHCRQILYHLSPQGSP